MKVNLISLTQAASGLVPGTLTPEQLIVYIARVSNPSNQMNHETADKLIRYLIKNKHWSPFEHVSMTIEIKTSRAIAAQILRHRSFSFQEFSQRYAEVTEFEPIQLRKQAEKNRQSSSEEFNPKIWFETKGINTSAEGAILFHNAMGQKLYQELIKAGVAKESARMILPLATQTTIYMTGTIRSWIHYLDIRCDEHTQLEHREIAESIKEIFIQQFPEISKALEYE
jgi:thymidylate synthase (FAD)